MEVNGMRLEDGIIMWSVIVAGIWVIGLIICLAVKIFDNEPIIENIKEMSKALFFTTIGISMVLTIGLFCAAFCK